MGKKIERNRSKTLPSSPSHSFSSSSSSDFEFRISISPRKSSAALCPADELFYKGQLLPLHLSPRISMVRTLLLASSSTSSSATATTTASRDSSSSTDSSSSSFSADFSLLATGDPSCDSSRPSSVADDERLNPTKAKPFSSCKYFSFSRIFKKDPPKSAAPPPQPPPPPVAKKMSSSAKEVMRKYLNKVRPLYEKLSQKQGRSCGGAMAARAAAAAAVERSDRERRESGSSMTSFSGSLKCPRMTRRSYVASCPSSMRSSPSHSGVLTRAGFPGRVVGSSDMEELQNAIQGAIAHCKNSMLQHN